MKPLLLFDFDGTIVDSIDIILSAIKSVALNREIRLSVDKKVLANKGFEGLLRNSGVSIFRVSSFVSDCHQEIEQTITQAGIHDHMKELLTQVSSYVDMCVVTSNSEQAVTNTLPEQVLLLFDGVYHAGPFSKHKVIRRLRRLYELKKSSVLYIGDESRDVHAARKAGVDSLAVTWGVQNKKSLLASRPTLLAQNATEAEHLIKAWIASR